MRWLHGHGLRFRLMREQYLGEGWGRAKVRGTPLNTGVMLRAALEAGAAPYGDRSTCHSVAWDAGAGEEGDRDLTNQFTRGGYPLGIIVNRDGRRFVDEGADYRNYTYAKYGRDILRQPDGLAFQVYGATTRPMLRAEDYDHDHVTVVEAGSLEKLAAATGIDETGLVETVAAFNASIDTSKAFDIPGLFVCREMLGGLFSGNYPRRHRARLRRGLRLAGGRPGMSVSWGRRQELPTRGHRVQHISPSSRSRARLVSRTVCPSSNSYAGQLVASTSRSAPTWSTSAGVNIFERWES